MSLLSTETDLSPGFPGLTAESYSDLNFRCSVICFLRQDGDIDGCHKLTTHSHPWCSSSGSTEKWNCIWWNMRRQEQKNWKEMDPRKYDETWEIVPHLLILILDKLWERSILISGLSSHYGMNEYPQWWGYSRVSLLPLSLGGHCLSEWSSFGGICRHKLYRCKGVLYTFVSISSGI